MLSAELARKHAHDAELHAERAGVELTRLEKLCEPGFDDAAMQAIRQLITTDGVVELSETNQKESIMRHVSSEGALHDPNHTDCCELRQNLDASLHAPFIRQVIATHGLVRFVMYD